MFPVGAEPIEGRRCKCIAATEEVTDGKQLADHGVIPLDSELTVIGRSVQQYITGMTV